MAIAQIGWDQRNKPAPLGYRRFKSAMLFLIPTLSALIKSFWIGSSVSLDHILLIINMAIPAILEAVSIFLGNGQYYSPSNQTMDNQKQQ